MTRSVLRSVLCLWATTLAVALMFFIRGCAGGGPVVVVKVDMKPVEFVER